jgi:selenocysteine lyase/cysteine desulfurase
VDPASLYASPNALATHYSRFRVAERLLLTGHSHQAWPDEAFEAQGNAWLDAARFVDDKWEHAFAEAQHVRAGFARLLGDAGGGIALAPNTHELVVRLLSALPLERRPKLVTTDGEFHTIRRQLDRLAEEGLEIVRVAERPLDTLAPRLARAVDDRTALVLISTVFFDTGRIARGLSEVAVRCRMHGARLLLDVYHQLNVVPLSLAAEDLLDAFVVGGGYKYCQLGEGNCFLRLPTGCDLRPVITGWYSEFGALESAASSHRVVYGDGGDRFAGATYDPTSHYRGAAVFRFFADKGLDPPLLRDVSQHQLAVLASAFDALGVDPAVIDRDRSAPLSEIAGFLALHCPAAATFVSELEARGVVADARGDALRFGPAPYLSDRQLRNAMGLLGEVARAYARR